MPSMPTKNYKSVRSQALHKVRNISNLKTQASNENKRGSMEINEIINLSSAHGPYD